VAPEPSKAVFLSYASEDAQAALRLCAGLRQAGIEVWFVRTLHSGHFQEYACAG